MTTVSTTIYQGVTYDVDDGDTLTVTALGAVMVTGVTAVHAGAGVTMNVAGDIYSDASGGVSAGANLHITLTATGSIISGLEAIEATGGTHIINNLGDILVQGTNPANAIVLGGLAGSVTNTGSIRALNGSGIIFASGRGAVVNSGVIDAFHPGGYGVYFEEGGSLTNKAGGVIDTGWWAVNFQTKAGTVVNMGTIGTARTMVGVYGSPEADHVTNGGTIRGTQAAVNLFEGNDVYVGTGGRTFGEVNGSYGNDTLTGGSFADLLIGDVGNDTLIGAGGADTLDGGDDDDRYQLASDTTDHLVDSSGIDLIWSTISRNLAGYPTIENLTLQGTANINGIGNGLNNVLVGNSGKNILTGGAGTDTLDGGAGIDTLNGGADNDTYVLGAETDTVIDSGGTGDTITSTITRSLAGYAAIENLTLLGTTNIAGTGNGVANSLTGNTGNNVLKGGGGGDFIVGGKGIYSLYGEAGGDTFYYAAVTDSPSGAGRDVIYDFNDSGVNTDTINLIAIPGLNNLNQITLTQAGANVLVSINFGMQLLLAGTTIGNGAGQVDAGDFLI
jgi:Ca2+-binding RTX toxin-like protein